MKSESGKNIRILILNADDAESLRIQAQLMKPGFSPEIQLAKKEQEFVKKVLKFEPDVVIASNVIKGYSGIEVYEDVRLALPHAFFILTNVEDVTTEMQAYALSGIDCFLTDASYPLLPFIVLQGFNRKHLEKIQFDAHQKLQERKMQLRAVFNNNQNAIFILGLKSEILDVNPMGATLLESGHEKLLGADFHRFISKDDVKNFRSAFASASRGKESSHEFGFSISRVSRKQAIINFVPIRNEERHITTLMIICKDVSDMFLIRQKFRMSEERFLVLADHAPVGIFYENMEGNCLFVNKAWCEYTGLTFKESLGKGWTRALHPEDQENLMNTVVQARKKNETFNIEHRIVDTKGNVKWMRTNGSPFIDEKAKLQGYVGTIYEVTLDKLHALELEQASKRQKISMQLAGLGVSERDLVNDTGTWSDELYEIFEMDKNEKIISLEDSINKNLHPEDKEIVRTSILKAIRGGGTQQAHFRIITRSGKTKYLRGISVVEKNLDGIPVKLVTALQDISHDREREQKLEDNEVRFRNYFNHSPDAIYIEDLDGNILEANEEACRIQGLSREELVGKNLVDIAPSEMHDEIFTNFKKMVQQEITGLKSFSWNKDGIKIPVQIKQRLIQYKNKPALLLHVRKM